MMTYQAGVTDSMRMLLRLCDSASEDINISGVFGLTIGTEASG